MLQLLLTSGADPACTDGGGRTALHLAAAGDFASALGLLLQQGGAALDAQAAGGVTPLQAAAISGAGAALRALVKAGAKVNMQVCCFAFACKCIYSLSGWLSFTHGWGHMLHGSPFHNPDSTLTSDHNVLCP